MRAKPPRTRVEPALCSADPESVPLDTARVRHGTFTLIGVHAVTPLGGNALEPLAFNYFDSGYDCSVPLTASRGIDAI